MTMPTNDPQIVKQISEAIIAESELAKEKGGWVTAIYPKLKKLVFGDWQIRSVTVQLVEEGRLKKQGEGSRTQWKPVILPEGEKPDVPVEEVISGEESIIAESCEPTDDDLISRIDTRLAALEAEKTALLADKDAILNSTPARERAKSLPPA